MEQGATLPARLEPLLHRLVAAHLAEMTAQVHRLASTYGHDHPHVQIARQHMADVTDLSEWLRKRVAT